MKANRSHKKTIAKFKILLNSSSYSAFFSIKEGCTTISILSGKDGSKKMNINVKPFKIAVWLFYRLCWNPKLKKMLMKRKVVLSDKNNLKIKFELIKDTFYIVS